MIFLAARMCGAQPVFDGTDTKGIESILQQAEEDSSSWRKEAEKRIRKHRMAELRLELIDRNKTVPLTLDDDTHRKICI